MFKEINIPHEALSRHLQTTYGAPVDSITEIGSGFHAVGYEIQFSGENPRVFLRVIDPHNFGHDLVSGRMESLLEAVHPLPHSLPTHAILGITATGEIVDISQISEVVAVAQLLPEGTTNLCSELRTPTSTDAENRALAKRLEPKALAMAQAMAEIHELPYTGDLQAAASLYQRSLRAVIHDDELTAGVKDLFNFSQISWVSHEDVVRFMADMERVRHSLGVHSERLTRVHGDYWANNIYFSKDNEIIITDGRIVWGEPVIDLGWMIGEFLMQDLVRFGHFGEDFTRIAQNAVDEYSKLRGDTQIANYIGLPYAFQAFAESFFTPDLPEQTRRELFATAWGALRSHLSGKPFDLNSMNIYTARGLDLLES